VALDIFCVLVVACLAIAGYRAGIVRQILLIACLVGAFFLSWPAAPYINAIVLSQASLYPAASYVCSCFLAWLLVYLVLRVIAYYINRSI
jgi:uncharacterized membrane protein required for colicin V production